MLTWSTVPPGAARSAKPFSSFKILQRDHINRADQLARMVIGEERSLRQRARVDIEVPKARQKVRQLNQLTDLLVSRRPVAPSRRFARPRRREARQAPGFRRPQQLFAWLSPYCDRAIGGFYGGVRHGAGRSQCGTVVPVSANAQADALEYRGDKSIAARPEEQIHVVEDRPELRRQRLAQQFVCAVETGLDRRRGSRR